MATHNWRPVETMDDWLRQIEKRVMHEERRPIPRPAEEVVGRGFRAYANEVDDWNSDGPIVGGHFYSTADQVINSPNDSKHWMGIVQSNSIGQGLQRVWEYIDDAEAASPDPALFTRAFVTNEDGTRTYTDWLQGTGGSGGGEPTGPAGGDLDGIYPNPTIRDGAIDIEDLSPATLSDLRLEVSDEGVTVVADAPKMDFNGAGVTALDDGLGNVLVVIPGTPQGAAGGDLAGTYPNPAIGNGKVTSAHIADGTIVAADLSTALQGTLPKRFAADLAALVAGTELLVTHNLGTLDVHTEFRINASGVDLELYWRVASTTQIGVTADVAFAASAVRCVVIA